MTSSESQGKGRPAPPPAPLWRQAFDAADRALAPRAENLVRTPAFDVGVTVVRRAQVLARDSVRGLTARAWHLLNLPAGSDISRLRTQIGALDREVRRLTVKLETERRRGSSPDATRSTSTAQQSTASAPGDTDADRAQPASRPRPRSTRRRTQRPPSS
jgi:hypothetical protein